MKNYVDYITDITCQLLAIDSPTGYTKQAAEFVMDEYKKLGYEPKMTVKGCVLVDIGGKNKDNGIVLAAHADTLGAMVSEIKGNGNLKVTPLGGMNPNNGEILAISSYPSFNLNEYKKYDQEVYNRNLPISMRKNGFIFKGNMVK